MNNKTISPLEEYKAIPADNSDEIDLRELFSVIWSGKWIILATTVLFAAISAGVALYQPNIYHSEATLAPAEEAQGGGLSGLASQFGGLASLAGVSLGGGNKADKSQLALEVLKSRQFISKFIETHHILPDLMADKKWDASSNKVIYDPAIYDASTTTWVREVKPPLQSKPSMQEAYSVFQKLITVTNDTKTGMVTLAIEHKSPYIAKQWVDWLVEDINSEMKTRDVEEATRSTEYLNHQIQQTNVADIRTVLFNLIEEQTKTIMFANVRDEYVFKTIDPAVVPELKAKPKRALIVVLGIVLGGIFSVFFILVRHFFKTEK
ncbi:Wzz/FepE/Etk N-terminal domain-containing protein [Shewanella sp. C32]|uniref:Wzz/FepE/Etk N-terminal domain-containing protein n=1 Tax=Shewanella electrica TaxID=515560 RepID=A0ABT2FMP8_9GAMM|nr:Wzz/FepE/Etk N-terminal domain-containing protein [Shewanella electrica]MCH1924603.1 Wzz/FepE/Etk N-terminal domain-containing protein [Shewanella electrica]MCS4556504.1 Wzz/FepE/Etk N-terminal domain-containing protein [Shewanella electrica]